MLLFLVDPNRFLFVLFVVALAVGVFFFFCVYVVYTYIFVRCGKTDPGQLRSIKRKCPAIAALRYKGTQEGPEKLVSNTSPYS